MLIITINLPPDKIVKCTVYSSDEELVPQKHLSRGKKLQTLLKHHQGERKAGVTHNAKEKRILSVTIMVF